MVLPASHCMSLLLVLGAAQLGIAAEKQSVPPYIKQCQLSSPKLADCIKNSLHHLSPYLVTGIPEIELPNVEPFILDSLSLQLTGGERGYKIVLTKINVFGISNFTVQKIKLSKIGEPFEGKVLLPLIKIRADYTSTGQLLILPATGKGDFYATFGNVVADLKGVISSTKKNGQDYLKLEKLNLNFVIKNNKMHVENIFNNNMVLTQATNLFLEENGNEVLNVMMPQLRVKIANVIIKILNQLLTHTPLQLMSVP